MKKINSLLVILISLLAVACSQEKQEEPQSEIDRFIEETEDMIKPPASLRVNLPSPGSQIVQEEIKFLITLNSENKVLVGKKQIELTELKKHLPTDKNTPIMIHVSTSFDQENLIAILSALKESGLEKLTIKSLKK